LGTPPRRCARTSAARVRCVVRIPANVEGEVALRQLLDRNDRRKAWDVIVRSYALTIFSTCSGSR
jgi:hypothetical protein